MNQIQDVMKTVQEGITLIATQAGMVVEHLWIILTKQQILYGLQEFLFGLMGIGFALIIARAMDQLKKTKMAKMDRYTLHAVLFVVMLVGIFWGASVMVDSLPRLFNPEYYSIKEAVDLLQKIKH